MSATPEPTPSDRPTPRQELIAAQFLAMGEPLSVAARMANLRPETVQRLRDDASFGVLLEDCAALAATPAERQDERLRRLLRRAVEQALADGRLGAMGAALRLLGLIQPRSGPAPGPAQPAVTAGLDPEPPSTNGGAAWGMYPDGNRGWTGPDGRPAMPGRMVQVVETPAGPVRLLDIEAEETDDALLTLLDGLDETETVELNQAAYPVGGPQWDPVTGTLWCWEAPERPAGPAEPDLLPSAEPAVEPLPPERSAIAFVEEEPMPPASPRDELSARLDDLLARGGPVTPEERDLADAVCFLSWPHWPPYTGAADLDALRRLLARRPLDSRTLTSLAGSACVRQADAGTRPVARSPAARGGEATLRTAARPRAGPPDAACRERHRLEVSREHGLYLARFGPWQP